MIINDIDNLIAEANENVSILIKQLNSNNYIYSRNIDKKIISASLIKVPIMLAILEEVNNKNLNLDDTILVADMDILNDTEVFENNQKYYSIYELINWMIINSDNTATNVLIKQVGMEKINNYITNTLKVKSTYLQRYMLDEEAIKKGLNNYTSQKDMLNIFTMLFNKEILNEELCNIAIEILYNQRCKNQVLRYIYDPIKYAHKTGSLDYLNHDVGVLCINDKLFYIGISVYNCKNKNGNRKLVGNIGKKAYDYIKINYMP